MLRSFKIAVLFAVVPSVLCLLDVSGLALREPATAHSLRAEASRNRSVQKTIDPATWGSSHAGKSVPDFVHGDECLFCHRNDIGPGWQKNAHGITVRQSEDAPEWQNIFKSQPAPAAIAPQVEYFLGSRHRLRFLKKEGYGKFAILNTQAELGSRRQVQKCIDVQKPA